MKPTAESPDIPPAAQAPEPFEHLVRAEVLMTEVLMALARGVTIEA